MLTFFRGILASGGRLLCFRRRIPPPTLSSPSSASARRATTPAVRRFHTVIQGLSRAQVVGFVIMLILYPLGLALALRRLAGRGVAVPKRVVVRKLVIIVRLKTTQVPTQSSTCILTHSRANTPCSGPQHQAPAPACAPRTLLLSWLFSKSPLSEKSSPCKTPRRTAIKRTCNGQPNCTFHKHPNGGSCVAEKATRDGTRSLTGRIVDRFRVRSPSPLMQPETAPYHVCRVISVPRPCDIEINTLTKRRYGLVRHAGAEVCPERAVHPPQRYENGVPG